MWLSGQQKRPADCGEGQTGIVTVGGSGAAVMLDSERRGLEVYSPAGYHWSPEAGQRVLVIQGQGEIPCITGVRQGGGQPRSVDISAGSVSIGGQRVSIGSCVAVGGQSVDLRGAVLINGEPLETVIARIVAVMMMGGG